jgi:hypothetical protein
MLVSNMCYKYNIVLELAKFENPFLALILNRFSPVFGSAGATIALNEAFLFPCVETIFYCFGRRTRYHSPG